MTICGPRQPRYNGTALYISSFKPISPVVLEKMFRFLPYIGMEAMLVMWPWPFEQISDPHIVRTLQMKFDKHWRRCFRGEVFWKCWQTFNQSDLRPRSVNDIGLWYSWRCMKHILSYQRVSLFWKNTMFHLSSTPKTKGPNLTFTKKRSRSTYGHHLNKLGSHLMLHTKFQGNQPRGSGEEDFLRFLPYMGIVAILFIRPRQFEQIFSLPSPGCCKWNLIEIGPEKKSFENDNTFNSSEVWPR